MKFYVLIFFSIMITGAVLCIFPNESEQLATQYQHSIAGLAAMSTFLAVVVSLYVAFTGSTRKFKGNIELWLRSGDTDDVTKMGFLLSNIVNHSYKPVYLNQNVLLLRLPFRLRTKPFRYYHDYNALELKPYAETQIGTQNLVQLFAFTETLYKETWVFPQWSIAKAKFYCQSVDGIKGKLGVQKNLAENLADFANRYAQAKKQKPSLKDDNKNQESGKSATNETD